MTYHSLLSNENIHYTMDIFIHSAAVISAAGRFCQPASLGIRKSTDHPREKQPCRAWLHGAGFGRGLGGFGYLGLTFVPCFAATVFWPFAA